MHENICFMSDEKYLQLENFLRFFKTNANFAKVEFVVNMILEYVSWSPACLSFFLPLKSFNFCRFFNLFSFSFIFIKKFQKISVRYSFLLFTTAYI